MFIDGTKMSGICECGHDHSMYTRFAVIENGALNDIEKYLSQAKLSGKRCALYGENTYRATAGKRPRAEQEIVLKSEGLHANEISTAQVLAELEPDIDLIFAIGSGTIHDIARYCAYTRGINFVSCPTGASVDGFCSSVCSMTWYGYKTTKTAVAPIIVVADTEVIKNAPMELARSGVGDIMAKYTALADWEIAHHITGEYHCPRIDRITRQAADDAMASIPGLLRGENKSYENLSYALIMSGLAMQMMGNSRPASGAEHHISHIIEMGPTGMDVAFQAMHGEKTGIGTLLVSAEYKRLGACEDIHPFVKPYTEINAANAESFFGEKLLGGVLKENEKDCLSTVSPEMIADAWDKVREDIARIPQPERLREQLEQLGAKQRLEEVGVDSAEVGRLLKYSPMVRNRLTLMRIERMLTY